MALQADRYLAEALRAYGVTHFFHVPVIVPSALKEMTCLGGTLPVMAHSEKAAAYMADGYARVSGRVGVCGAQAVGGTNLASGLRDAYLARIPVLALSGGRALPTYERLQYQEVDDTAAFEAVTKLNATVWVPDRLPDLLAAAFRAASTGMPAPVHLELSGVMGEVATTGEVDRPRPVDARFGRFPAIRPAAPDEDVFAAHKALQAAERPVLVAGGGVRSSGAAQVLVDLASEQHIPVATALNAKGLIPDAHPLALGPVGEYSSEAANRAVCEADLVFYVGSQTGGLVTRGWSVPPPDTPVVHLDIEPQNIGRNLPRTLGLCGDARTVLSQLLAARGRPPDRSGWLGRIAALKAEWASVTDADERSEAVPLTPPRMCRELTSALPSDALIVADTGHAAAWLAQNIRVSEARQAVIRAHGSLGWSFPAALGAKSAAPHRPVVCFTGDGGLLYHLGELETAVRYGLDVVVLVNNNRSLNQEKVLWHQSPAYDHLWRMRVIDFAATAKAFGCLGLRAESPGEVEEAVRTALVANRPAVVEVITDENAVARPSWGPEGSPGMYG